MKSEWKQERGTSWSFTNLSSTSSIVMIMIQQQQQQQFVVLQRMDRRCCCRCRRRREEGDGGTRGGSWRSSLTSGKRAFSRHVSSIPPLNSLTLTTWSPLRKSPLQRYQKTSTTTSTLVLRLLLRHFTIIYHTIVAIYMRSYCRGVCTRRIDYYHKHNTSPYPKTRTNAHPYAHMHALTHKSTH